MDRYGLFFVLVGLLAVLTAAAVVRTGPRHPGGRVGYLGDLLLTRVGSIAALAALLVIMLAGETLPFSVVIGLLVAGVGLMIGAPFLASVRAARLRIAGLRDREPMQHGDEVR